MHSNLLMLILFINLLHNLTDQNQLKTMEKLHNLALPLGTKPSNLSSAVSVPFPQIESSPKNPPPLLYGQQKEWMKEPLEKRVKKGQKLSKKKKGKGAAAAPGAGAPAPAPAPVPPPQPEAPVVQPEEPPPVQPPVVEPQVEPPAVEPEQPQVEPPVPAPPPGIVVPLQEEEEEIAPQPPLQRPPPAPPSPRGRGGLQGPPGPRGKQKCQMILHLINLKIRKFSRK